MAGEGRALGTPQLQPPAPLSPQWREGARGPGGAREETSVRGRQKTARADKPRPCWLA